MIPYRAKNPPESFPYATLGLILLNTLIFAITSEYFLVIRDEVTKAWAVSHDTLNPLRLITAMFLHGSIIHLGGNMLFLWIFGAAAEGRLGTIKYLLIYFIAGITGGLLHDGVVGYLHPTQFGLGASGAIMGIAEGTPELEAGPSPSSLTGPDANGTAALAETPKRGPGRPRKFQDPQ